MFTAGILLISKPEITVVGVEGGVTLTLTTDIEVILFLLVHIGTDFEFSVDNWAEVTEPR